MYMQVISMKAASVSVATVRDFFQWPSALCCERQSRITNSFLPFRPTVGRAPQNRALYDRKNQSRSSGSRVVDGSVAIKGSSRTSAAYIAASETSTPVSDIRDYARQVTLGPRSVL